MPGSAKYRARGDCSACGKPKLINRTKCQLCLDKALESAKRSRAKRLANGLCSRCGKPNDNLPKVNCISCTNKYKSKRQELKKLVIDAYGGKCNCCGETIIEFLSIDHVNNDGAAHRRVMANTELSFRRQPATSKNPTSMMGVHIYRVLKKTGFPPGFQVLCMNCNFAKEKYGNGVCPHKLLKK